MNHCCDMDELLRLCMIFNKSDDCPAGFLQSFLETSVVILVNAVPWVEAWLDEDFDMDKEIVAIDWGGGLLQRDLFFFLSARFNAASESFTSPLYFDFCFGSGGNCFNSSLDAHDSMRYLRLMAEEGEALLASTDSCHHLLR